eukprot:m.327171 g.327171  ORF g.327171 m.327171 type:complete len:216 (+) comp48210_c0_seq1:72-719(+)
MSHNDNTIPEMPLVQLTALVLEAAGGTGADLLTVAMAQAELDRRLQEEALNENEVRRMTYAQLRDTINSSDNVNTLEVARDEFHRRLRAHGCRRPLRQRWHEKSTPSETPAEAAAATACPRCFQVAIPKNNAAGRPRGWWFIHYEGSRPARQMELFPDRPPLLLLAGRDDRDMCELSLEESGLARRRGAEILPREFEDEWVRQGGAPFQQARAQK